MNVLGCDVSTWQDADSTPQMMDFAKARAAGARFVFIKASQGGLLDADYMFNWQHAEGLLLRGMYHFYDWRIPYPTQVDLFCRLVEHDPGELPPVLDYEMTVSAPHASLAAEIGLKFLRDVEQRTGKTPMLYTSPGFWKAYGANLVAFAHFPLWIAHYGVRNPTVPKPWTRWEFWQYTDRGPGLAFGAESLQIDLNWWNGTQAEFDAVYGGNPDLPPGPSGPPTRTVIITALWGLRVRTEPNTNSRVLKTLRYGTEVRVIDQPGDWLKLAGEPGWISRQWVRQ